jgi:hypothetical protein
VNALVARLLRAGMRRGFQRGVLDGNRAWIVLGGAALVGHLAGRALGRKEEVVFRERLEPGESVRVTHLPRP